MTNTLPSITCPICHLTSYHLKDIEQGYCGHCQDWTGRPTMAHMLKENAVVVRKGGCEAACVCGWRSGLRFSPMLASAAFREHYTEATGRDYDQEMGAVMSDFAKKLKLGATGAFPQGKLNRSDEGELRMAISNDGSIVRLDFGKPIAWIGLPPNEAKQLAALLMQHAASCQNGTN